MFSKTTAKDNATGEPVASRKIAPSVISSDVNLLGNIISDGLIDFDGNIHGNIQCHTLVIRKDARIHGEVKADSVQVAGSVKGTIEARNVVLQDGADVEGTIMHEQISVEEGATVDGKLKKVSKAPAIEQATATTTPTTAAAEELIAADAPTLDAEGSEDVRIMEHIRLISANE